MKRTDRELMESTRESWKESQKGLRAAARRGAASGQVYVFPSEGCLEWAWLAAEPDSERVLLLPVDTYPLVGSTDVLAEDGSHRVVRCRYRVELPFGKLEQASLAGALPHETARKASEISELCAAGLDGAASEVDLESEYREWIESVVEGEVRLLEQWGSGEPRLLSPDGLARLDQAPTFSPGSVPAADWTRLRHRERFFRAAAAVLLTSSVLFGYLALDFPDSVVVEQVGINLPLVWLGPEEVVRGSIEAIQLNADDTPVVFVLLVHDTAYSGAYRAEIYRVGESEPLWIANDLTTVGVNEVTLSVPRSWLSAGSYRLVLRARVQDQGGADEREAPVLGTYRVQIETAAAGSPLVP